MKTTRFFLFLAFLPLCFSSCTSKITLSKEEALSILKQGFKRYCERDVHRVTSHYNNQQPEPMLAKFQALEKQGFIVVMSHQKYSRGRPAWIDYTWKPLAETIEKYKSDKGKNRYKVAELVVQDIIGISIQEEEKTALVRFSYTMIPTSFQSIQFSKYRPCDMPTLAEEEVSFVLYDTGWKIKQ